MAHTKDSLYQLSQRLHDRDFAILNLLTATRCMFTGQIRRVLFYNAASQRAGNSAASRNLNKLKKYGLVGSLDRKIGSAHAGSTGFIWYITEQGRRLLKLQDPDAEDLEKRERFIEPGAITLRHRLAVVEHYVIIFELTFKSNLQLQEIQFEPTSWRYYQHHGKRVSLRPDLYIRMINDGYEYLIFFEVDLATENMQTILHKCERYHDYYHTGIEQKANDVFPVVLWVVPNQKRKDLFVETLDRQYKKTAKLFCVITPDELEHTILSGFEDVKLY